MSKLEVLVVTMHQNNLEKYKQMNIQTDVVLANQSDRRDYVEEIINGNKLKMITTPYRGVGKNRNMALLYSTADYLLFADDDMIYVDGYEESIIKAFEELKNADVIIFSCNFTKGNIVFNAIKNNIKRLNVFNCFRYGTATMAVRRKSILKANIWFSLLFGGGTIYGSGEDSLFLKECIDKKLKIYSHDFIIGNCAKDESTWFKGYDEKFFYDKGALCAAMFHMLKYLAATKLLMRFKRLSDFSCAKCARLMIHGMKGFRSLSSYDKYVIYEKGK